MIEFAPPRQLNRWTPFSLAVNAWIGIIGTVVGALLGGSAAWLSARFQLHRQEERERKRLFLSKLEELYEVVAQFKDSYKMSTMSLVKTLTAGEAADMSDLPALPIEKLQMLIGFYAPELEPLLVQLFLRREEFGNTIISCIRFDPKIKRRGASCWGT